MPTATPTEPTARMQLARASQALRKDPTNAALRAARDHAAQEHRTAKIAQYVTKLVNQAPPLTAEQRDRLATLLRPGVSR